MVLAALLAFAVPATAWAAATERSGPVGYGGAKIQMTPLMAPYRAKNGQLAYQVVTLRIRLNADEFERPSCFMIPYVHEQFLLYFYKAKLTAEDFVMPRQEVLAKTLLDLALRVTDRGYYSGLEFVGDDPPPLEPKSQAMSNQCK